MRLLGVDGQRVDLAAAGATAIRRSSYGSGGRSKSCAMPCRPSTSTSSTLRAARGQCQGEGRGDRGLACAALAGDHVQSHAVPIGVPRVHVSRLPNGHLPEPTTTLGSPH